MWEVSGGQSSSGQFGAGQGQSSGSYRGGGQVYGGHGSSSQGGQFGTHQGGQYGTSQGSHFQTSQGGQFSTSQGGQSGGQFNNRGQTYNKSWSDSYNEGLTVEEQEQIRRKLTAAATNPQYGSQGVHTSQGVYGQGQGASEGGQVIRRANRTRTVYYDANGNVVYETSTEYGSLGHEGEAGSSFNK